MRKDEDTTNSMYQGMADRAMQLYVQTSTVASYIEPEILDLPAATLERLLRETPELGLSGQQLRELNIKRGHIDPAEIEATMTAPAQIAHAPSNHSPPSPHSDLTPSHTSTH